MRLDQIIANIRLRNPWEAIDLGFALIRHSWREIYLPWFILLFTFAGVIFLVVPHGYREYALFGVWLLKPIYDRFLLHMISQRLFNEQLTPKESLAALPKLMRSTGLLGGLTFRRPSFSRGFNLPIWQLEQLRGKARSERQSLLLNSAHSHAIGLTLGMIFIEITLYFSLYALIIAFLPDTFQHTAIGWFFADDPSEDVSQWLHLLDHIIYALAVFIIEPFYVAASFTLYMNRRTQLEAWEIELTFRQLATRIEKQTSSATHATPHTARHTRTKTTKHIALALVPLLLFFTLTASNPVYAKDKTSLTSEENLNTETETEYFSPQRHPSKNAADVIHKIMQRKELSNEKKDKQWVKIKKDQKDKKDDNDWNLAGFFEPFVKIFSMLFELSLWIVLAFGTLMLFITRHKWLHLFQQSRQEHKDYQAPEVMFGMDIRPESLPENIPEAAQQLWQESKHRDSLSLLYRGALTQLVTIDQLPLKPSQTEGDIIKLARNSLQSKRHIYLKNLTEQWKQIAYAHHLPEESKVSLLFNRWLPDFIHTDVDTESNAESNAESNDSSSNNINESIDNATKVVSTPEKTHEK